MEHCWIEVIPASLLQQWEISEEVQNWIKTNNQQRLEQDKLYQKIQIADVEVERLVIDEDGGRAHPDGDEVTSHPI